MRVAAACTQQGGSEGEEDGGWDSSCTTLKVPPVWGARLAKIIPSRGARLWKIIIKNLVVCDDRPRRYGTRSH